MLYISRVVEWDALLLMITLNEYYTFALTDRLSMLLPACLPACL
ncbi:MAG: hypothetical protein ACI9SB_002085, partial [Candidatus Azotimanducaceae bacterium]